MTITLIAVIGLLIAVSISRAVTRRRRPTVRLWLIPFAGERAGRDPLQRLFEEWHRQLIVPWPRRAWVRQPEIALELTEVADGDGRAAARLAIVVAPELVTGMEAALQACYPNCRLRRERQTLPPVRRVIRVRWCPSAAGGRPAHPDVHAVTAPDMLLTAMAQAARPSVVQYVLRPAPAPAARARRRTTAPAVGQATAVASTFDPLTLARRAELTTTTTPTVQTPVCAFGTEIRIAAPTLSACRAIAAAARELPGLEGELKTVALDAWLPAPGRVDRLQRGAGGAVSPWGREVMSASELATVWQLPSPELSTVGVMRSKLPRLPASSQISRDHRFALCRDEHGAVAIAPEDRGDGLMVVGGARSGKTSLLARAAATAAGDANRAILIVTAHSGSAAVALAAIPRGRTVQIVDLEQTQAVDPLATIVRRGEVLVIDAKVEVVGPAAARAIIVGLTGELARSRAMLAIDDAHLLSDDAVLDALTSLTDAGVELVTTWRAAAVDDRGLPAEVRQRRGHRCVLAGAGPTSGVMIESLPRGFAICEWRRSGVTLAPFLARLLPPIRDDAIVRERLATRTQALRPAEISKRPPPTPSSRPPAEKPSIPAPVHAPAPVADPSLGKAEAQPAHDEPPQLPAREPVVQASDSFNELDLDSVHGLQWEKLRPLAANRHPEPTERDHEILAALWSYRLLFANQIWRRWWPDASARSAQQGLKRMTEAGWVKRFMFQLPEAGARQRVYCLTKEGFELARGRPGRAGATIPEDETWREPQINDPRRVLRDLHVNGWVLAFEHHAGPAMASWHGPRESRITPPRRKVRGEWVELRPAEIVVGTNQRLQGTTTDRLEAVTPDATIELRGDLDGARTRLELMVDLDRARTAEVREARLKRYDLFLAGWGRLVRRYRELGALPTVVFVCEDDHTLLQLLRTADHTLTTRIAKAGQPEAEWPFPGRRGIFFAVERDIHDGSLNAIALPEHPPELRMQLEGAAARICRPRRVQLVDPRLLGSRPRSTDR